jgi:5-methyltetrahydrofolate--homocysteine methyltransferase
MGVVGQRFQDQEIYVPEMLISARAMKAAVALLEPLLVGSGYIPDKLAVMGTIKGDLHDIGKNLVGMMLKGASFAIVDLGTNVTVDRFMAAAREHKADIIGISALLTTTMGNMRGVIEAVRAADDMPNLRVIVGGAAVTTNAQQIGADGWAPDAGSAVVWRPGGRRGSAAAAGGAMAAGASWWRPGSSAPMDEAPDRPCPAHPGAAGVAAPRHHPRHPVATVYFRVAVAHAVNVVHLAAPHAEPVTPRADRSAAGPGLDGWSPLRLTRRRRCVTIFLGGRDRYEAEHEATPGTYWYVQDQMDRGNDLKGWLLGDGARSEDVSATRAEYVQRFGTDNADYLMEVLGEWRARYERGAFLDTGLAPADAAAGHARMEAERRGWRFERKP